MNNYAAVYWSQPEAVIFTENKESRKRHEFT